MRVLLLDGYHPKDGDRGVVLAATETLGAKGHDVERLELHDFEAVMSPAERRAYHSEQPVISEDVRDSAERVRVADALLFCYPSVAFTIPAPMKGWLERVMVMGVAFVFDDNHKIRPGMPHVRRVGAITSTPHGHLARLRARDGGRRTTARTLRLAANKRCRSTFAAVASPVGDTEIAKVRKALRRW